MSFVFVWKGLVWVLMVVVFFKKITPGCFYNTACIRSPLILTSHPITRFLFLWRLLQYLLVLDIFYSLSKYVLFVFR